MAGSRVVMVASAKEPASQPTNGVCGGGGMAEAAVAAVAASVAELPRPLRTAAAMPAPSAVGVASMAAAGEEGLRWVRWRGPPRVDVEARWLRVWCGLLAWLRGQVCVVRGVVCWEGG